MHIEWTKVFETGHAEIDREHKAIVDIINRLEDMPEDEYSEDVGDILCQLTEYVIVHFGREEQMMLRVRYPDYDAHMLSHCQFFAHLTRFTYGFETRQTGLSRDIQEYLAGWLVEHEAIEDAAFIRYWLAYGGASAPPD